MWGRHPQLHLTGPQQEKNAMTTVLLLEWESGGSIVLRSVHGWHSTLRTLLIDIPPLFTVFTRPGDWLRLQPPSTTHGAATYATFSGPREP